MYIYIYIERECSRLWCPPKHLCFINIFEHPRFSSVIKIWSSALWNTRLYMSVRVFCLSLVPSLLLSLSLFLSCSPSLFLCTHAVLYAFPFLPIPFHPLRVKSIDARHSRRRT